MIKINCDITIVIPIYNVESYISKCIESICNQTITDFDVILVDDGGCDSSLYIAKEILELHDIRYNIVFDCDSFGNIVNHGLGEARNLGIKHVQSTWIICIDADDYIHPQMIEIYYDAINKFSNVDFIFSNYTKVLPSEEISFSHITSINYQRHFSNELLKAFYNRTIPIIVPSILIKKSILDNNLFPSNCRFSEDGYFTYKLLLNNSLFSIQICNCLYYYVQRQNSIMTSSSIEMILEGYNYFKALDKDIQDYELDNTIDISMIFPRWILAVAHSSAKMMNYDDYKKLIVKMQIHKNLRPLRKSKDMRIRISRLLLCCCPSLFYLLMRLL